ncbi:hypothetical protein [Edaphobacter aggregans]|uniref:hypothetical protein n=1 Tax=Edaphobacter aggregans TaxID=570835 RepID=UPI0012FC8170|nr:hypothetical protein [Edaphobacter aggregans]
MKNQHSKRDGSTSGFPNYVILITDGKHIIAEELLWQSVLIEKLDVTDFALCE